LLFDAPMKHNHVWTSMRSNEVLPHVDIHAATLIQPSV
jgi:hypothetical protein